ncbi:DUF2239 family protein [Tabrizicola sp. J26]|uniref:DUF2239 family protein n=1 Tax=Alitabrizicola rongguiensis TaxID=2909234 RepID=UPI001F433C9D|nr:DUF2239 family protein [Tabrizicola rongguiensis]MCF1709590.1 DUF2239 family protein [Tabrizicola rongguiensis]
MTDEHPLGWTAFQGTRRIAQGPLAEVGLAVRRLDETRGPVLIFDDATGRVLDLDLRGSDEEVRARLAPNAETPVRGRGRPKLGVTAREVTLLPRHWDWLADQPGGASAALRRLVDEARKADDGRTVLRQARERCYRFLSGIAGDLPGFEEASRALFAGDGARFSALIADWPGDIADHALRLLER